MEKPGTFRKVYREIRESSAQHILQIKEHAEDLEKLMKQVQSREMSLALTNLEQAIMWATKAIVLHDESTRND